MIMKSLFAKAFMALLVVVGVSATAQESIITKNELPASAQKFINKYFANSTVDYVKKDKEILSTDYKVRFTNGVELEFDSDGVWTEIDGNKNEIPTGFINKNIVSYVNAKFQQTKIMKIEKGRFGKYEVRLLNGLELEFNSEGQFKRIDD